MHSNWSIVTISGFMEQIFYDKAVKKEIDKLLVKCPHHIAGCEWTGQFKDCLVSS